MDIREALSQLDSMNDDHWTGDNVPRLDVLSDLVGRKVTRKEVFDAAPKFSRSSMEIPTEPKADSGAEGEGEPDTGSFATMPMRIEAKAAAKHVAAATEATGRPACPRIAGLTSTI